MANVDKLNLPMAFLARHQNGRHLQAVGDAATMNFHFPRLSLDFSDEFSGISWGIKVSAFRHLDFGPSSPEKIFRSSGTSEQGRSQSAFSKEGLDAYRKSITTGFFARLAVLRGSGSSLNSMQMAGISLIPKPEEWPDSSLAAMVGWIAAQTPVIYANAESVAAAVGQCGGEPVWVFGTAFHFIPLLEAGQARTLPRGSVVIYTGGTKGKTRDVAEDALIRSIAFGFGIPESCVIAEYGMSELASAAYTVQKDDWRNPEKRKLRFQSGAIPFVVTSCTYEKGTPFFHGTRNGRGLLGVIDFNRIDLPAPVITEDVVKLEPNGDFTLLGRAKLAPLKGCSLLAADGIGSMSQRSAGWSPTANDGIFSLAAFRKPRQQILQTLTKFLESEVAACALARDIGSNAAARFALRDALEAAKHLRGDALFEALRQSRATDWMESGKDQPMRLLMIPPNTHPIALLHPLALALCADFHAVVRLPRNQESPRSFTVELLNHLQRSGINVGTLGSQFRLGSAGQRLSQEGFTATLVFGNDDTIQEIRNVSSMRVFGHGGALTASVASWEEIPSQIEAVISDTFALMQEGCMASRLLGLVIPNDLPVDTAVTILSGALEKCWWRVWGEPLSPLHSGGLITHGLVATSPGLPAIVVKEKASPALYGPVLNVGLLRGNHGLADLFSWPDQWPQLKMLTVSPGLLALLERKFGELRQDKLTVRPLGTANKPAWNGLHFGRPVFS